MKHYYSWNNFKSKSRKIPRNVMRVNYYDDYDDLEFDHDDSWQAKAMRLQARRWRKIKNGGG